MWNVPSREISTLCMHILLEVSTWTYHTCLCSLFELLKQLSV